MNCIHCGARNPVSVNRLRELQQYQSIFNYFVDIAKLFRIVDSQFVSAVGFQDSTCSLFREGHLSQELIDKVFLRRDYILPFEINVEADFKCFSDSEEQDTIGMISLQSGYALAMTKCGTKNRLPPATIPNIGVAFHRNIGVCTTGFSNLLGPNDVISWIQQADARFENIAKENLAFVRNQIHQVQLWQHHQSEETVDYVAFQKCAGSETNSLLQIETSIGGELIIIENEGEFMYLSVPRIQGLCQVEIQM